MKLIVGLGNPGSRYDNTRHNMGFMLLDYYANLKKIEFNRQKFDGLYAEFVVNGEKVFLMKPQRYINLSGDVIRKYIDFYKIDISDLLIISDDLDMPFGKIKLKYRGSSGGHNGLKNIISNLGTENFNRIKIGISNDKKVETKDYVLAKLSVEELNNFDCVKETVSNILDDYFVMTFDNLMNKYNTK